MLYSTRLWVWFPLGSHPPLPWFRPLQNSWLIETPPSLRDSWDRLRQPLWPWVHDTHSDNGRTDGSQQLVAGTPRSHTLTQRCNCVSEEPRHLMVSLGFCVSPQRISPSSSLASSSTSPCSTLQPPAGVEGNSISKHASNHASVTSPTSTLESRDSGIIGNTV